MVIHNVVHCKNGVGCFRLKESKSFNREGLLESDETSEDRRTISDMLFPW